MNVSDLGEMERIQGRIAVHGRVAYVPQQAWLHNGSLRLSTLISYSLQAFSSIAVSYDCYFLFTTHLYLRHDQGYLLRK